MLVLVHALIQIIHLQKGYFNTAILGNVALDAALI